MMKSRIWTAMTLAAVLLGVIGVIRLTRTGPVPAPPAADVCTDHDHAEPALHPHDESCDHEHEAASDLEMSEQEILEAQCEHGTLTHLCADCRFEVGVVRVDESVADRGMEGPLFRVERAGQIRQAAVLKATGEVGLDENRAVHIRPRIPGVIHSVAVDIGDRVSGSDVLFEMESTELGRALGDFEKNRAMAGLARQNYEREEALFERRISSEWDLIQARMAFEEYQTALRAAEAELRVLGLTPREIEELDQGAEGLQYGRLPIRAPIDGVIIEKHAVAGERVDPEHEVMLLADLGTVWVWADIYEQDLAVLIEAGGRGKVPVEVTVRAFPDRAFRGYIDYIGATMDERTRTVRVRATVANDDQLLRPGMFCDVRATLDSPRTTLAVPAEAVLADQGSDFVFRRLKDNLFVRRPVARGRQQDGRVEILAGLDPGEQIVTQGAFLLKSDVLRSKMGAG